MNYNPTSNSKRLAKNTLLLYFRMLLIMAVSLYTVRVVLDTLGTVDYGIYNVVGGIVTMFSFLSSTMASASQRFFAFELGRKNYDQLKKTFSMTMTIYCLIALVIVILAETVGLWFLNNKMTIPVERMEAANWIYQFSILSFMMTMFTIPYYAAIIAHERMRVFAYVSIVEVALKLLIVYLLVVFSFDKLKLYAVLIFGVSTLITLIYRTYCQRKFEECRFTFYWDSVLFKEIISYSGWNLFGSMAGILKNQGINILLNVYFNPAVNAARAIAYQVNSAINQFVTNFSTAVNPQIIKHYAAGERKEMINLVFKSSKFSYFLLFVLSMPVLLETHFILAIWLKNIPEYVVLFTRLVIINALVDSLASPLITSALATGKIKQYQMVVGGIALLNIPVSYLLLKFGLPPQSTMYVAIIIATINLFSRLIMLQKMIQFPVIAYFGQVISKAIIVTVLSYLTPIILLFNMGSSIIRFFTITASGLITTLIFIYFVGLSKDDRAFLTNILHTKITNKLPFKQIKD